MEVDGCVEGGWMHRLPAGWINGWVHVGVDGCRKGWIDECMVKQGQSVTSAPPEVPRPCGPCCCTVPGCVLQSWVDPPPLP